MLDLGCPQEPCHLRPSLLLSPTATLQQSCQDKAPAPQAALQTWHLSAGNFQAWLVRAPRKLCRIRQQNSIPLYLHLQELFISQGAAQSSVTGPVLAASVANSILPPAATPAAASVQKGLKIAVAISTHSAMRQRLQQSRTHAECSMVQLGDLPVAYAVSSLAQPGPTCINSFAETSPDSSTMLPEARRVHGHSQASTAGQSLPMQHSTLHSRCALALDELQISMLMFQLFCTQ